MSIRTLFVLICTALLALTLGCQSQQTNGPGPLSNAQDHAQQSAPEGDEGSPKAIPVSNKGSGAKWKTAVAPKALSDKVNKGLAWLAEHQLPSGGWGQGDEAPNMRQNNAAIKDKPNVADTSMAVMAFIRAGSTASEGPYASNVERGIKYILSEVEGSDRDSLYVTKVRGTRVQGKIGTYVDTFTSLMVLTEAKGTMKTKADNGRLAEALDKVLVKIEKNQQKDGTWANQGWAPVLTQSLASKGLNRASQSGLKVKKEILSKAEGYSQKQYDVDSGGFAKGGSAGIDLYAGAANTSALRDSVNTKQAQKPALRAKVKNAPTEVERKDAQDELDNIRQTEERTVQVEKALIGRLKDPSFVQGFGNNGGEEFLSYMLVSETLVAKGGEEWKRWDDQITTLVNRVQNTDGSWTGHHCITGRTFCTAAALLVLLSDRTPIPDEAS